jgi:hypothetical protein
VQNEFEKAYFYSGSNITDRLHAAANSGAGYRRQSRIAVRFQWQCGHTPIDIANNYYYD